MAAKEARSELGELRGALRGLEVALDAKNQETQKCRTECSNLRTDLRHMEQKAAVDALQLQRRDVVLGESAAVLRHFLCNRGAESDHAALPEQTLALSQS